MGKTRSVRRLTVALAGLALVLSACGEGGGETAVTPTSAGTGSFPVTVRDDEGVSVTMKAPPRRIVTFAPSNTEIVFALGLGKYLVGVSGPFDNFPKPAKKITEVGGAGEFGVDPNIEKVVSLRPDLMLTIAGGEEWKKRLRDEFGINVFTINATDYSDLLNDIRKVGALTGATTKARDLITYMQKVEREVRTKVANEPSVPCFFEVYYPPLTTVGPNSFIFDVLERTGCDPVTDEAKTDYPEWSVEQLVADAPEVYLVSSESGVSPKAVGQRPGFDAIPAVREGRVELVTSDLVARPGPRIVEGLVELSRILHPGV